MFCKCKIYIIKQVKNELLYCDKTQQSFEKTQEMGYSRKNPHTPDRWGHFLTPPPLTWISWCTRAPKIRTITSRCSFLIAKASTKLCQKYYRVELRKERSKNAKSEQVSTFLVHKNQLLFVFRESHPLGGGGGVGFFLEQLNLENYISLMFSNAHSVLSHFIIWLFLTGTGNY